MSTIDTSTWNPDPALNESIGDIPLNSNASIAQTWQAIQMLMAAGGLHGLQLVTFDGATASADGKQGLVPAPDAGDQDKVLKGDGTWGNTPTPNLGTASRAVVTDANGDIAVSSVTATELGHLSGVTSAVQTQLDAKATDSGVVHNTGTETVAGAKTFSSDAAFSSAVIMTGNIRKNADNDELYVCGGSGGSNARGAYLRLKGVSASSNAGLFFLCTAKVSDSYANLNGYPNGTLTWNGQNIQTSSDERLKTPLSAVPDGVLDAWGDVQWGRFQYLDAVARKGASARLHLGLIAQKVKAAFEARGLDACAYGILCYDVVDEIWMVRYAEAAAMEACYQRRRADRLEARIAALEEKMNA